MQQVSIDDRLGVIATRIPAATRIFYRHDLDFCCRGGQTLATACQAAGVDVEAVIDELQGKQRTPEDVRWDREPLPDLVRFIVEQYHEPLRRVLEGLEVLARKTLDAHCSAEGERFPRLAIAVEEMSIALRDHMLREEQVLFPSVLLGDGRLAAGPVTVLELHHETALDSLREIRTLTDDFTPPREAGETHKALYRVLAELDYSLQEHIHLENNVLFPRALSE